MKLNFKENLIPFCISAASSLLALVGVVLYYVSNGLPGYSFGSVLGNIVAIIAVFVIAASCFLSVYFDADHNLVALLQLAGVILAMVAVGVIIAGRVLTISAVFSFDSKNKVAWNAVYTGMTSLGLYLVSAISLSVAAFFGKK